MLKFIRQLIQNDSGQGMAEYALILAFITMAVILTLTGMGQAITSQFGEVATAFE